MRLNLLFFFIFLTSYSQTEKIVSEIDSLYREDQIYMGVNYCSLNNRPASISQEKISLGFNFGFLRDFPVNKSRTISIALGFGYSFKNYNNSLLISEVNNQIEYSNSVGSKNYFRLHHLDFPIEFRWRTSSFESHKFWRIYTGFKYSYLFSNYSYYSDPKQIITVNNNPDFRKSNFSIYTSLGWNTWNVFFSYGLNPIFSSQNSTLNSINAIDIGLIFYIL